MVVQSSTIQQRLVKEKQRFFLPYYKQIVKKYPSGITSKLAKQKVKEFIQRIHGFDVFDPTISGTYSNGAVKADQWANNLVSNMVLDKEDGIIAIRDRTKIRGPVVLYPCYM